MQLRIRIGLLVLMVMLLATALVFGCGSRVAYQPERFRDDLTALIQLERYREAIGLLGKVDLETQLDHDGDGCYMLIAQDLIFRPGLPSDASYFPEDGDWELPGTSDAVPFAAKGWQDAAKAFAQRYNAARWDLDHP